MLFRFVTSILCAICLQYRATAYAQNIPQPSITCDALSAYVTEFQPGQLGSCTVPDTQSCRRMQCVAPSGPIHMLEVYILPCGANGMKPGLQVTLSDSNHQTLLNGTFYQTMSSPLSGVTSTLNINIVKKSNGVTFGLDLVSGTGSGGTTVPLLRQREVPIDSTEYACPSLAGLTQPTTTTCPALDRLGGSASPSGLTCTTNPSCLAIRCIGGELFPLYIKFVSIAILPCANPPAAHIVMVDHLLHNIVNATVSRSSHLDTGGLTGSFNIRIVVDNERTTFGLGIDRVRPSDTEPFFTFTSIPISTELCSGILPLPATGVATGTLFTTRQPDTANIRLSGGSSSSTGRLEVFLYGQWGTVCASAFYKTEADVACKQLQGFGQAESYGEDSSYITSFLSIDFTLPTLMSNVECADDSALTIQSCSYTVHPMHCSHDSDVGLRCSSCSLYLCGDGECTTATACDGVVECQDGSDEACGLSTVAIIGITLGSLFLLAVIIIVASVYACSRGACKRSSSAPRSPEVEVTAYNPAPQNLAPVV